MKFKGFSVNRAAIVRPIAYWIFPPTKHSQPPLTMFYNAEGTLAASGGKALLMDLEGLTAKSGARVIGTVRTGEPALCLTNASDEVFLE